MAPEAPVAADRSFVVYFTLLLVQTGAASVLFWMIFPLFQKLVMRSGEAQELDIFVVIGVVSAATVMQMCYWARYRYVAVWRPFHSCFVGHLLMFASRASFFFGGALFSVIFFRHVPQLEVLPPLGQGIAKTLGVMAVLFALFCYSLELERLGKVIEEQRHERNAE
ncbi:hypothetical protein B0E45_20525 [Sinorhizobium sp. A49]|uniref:hypothetical protein n=1 Tax=Sinorhizobium sp. A49 TaxID=1945861 RepID=UPI000985CD2A|nr:hypothetical protein [Sinorhizobium sp. A49]OOG67796.1 hypothetical protein B0E45_20525 [Sinorhizobium sp. A49]